MGRRKAWKDLKPEYRERLKRRGITEEMHKAGVDITPARGHGSKSKERKQARDNRDIASYKKRMVDLYHLDAEDVEANTEGIPRDELAVIAREQEAMEVDYLLGKYRKKGHPRWEKRSREMPDYMFFYHGPFG